ncbi:MAG: PD40 domain-containing protein [Planctomycetes bacterium]|nr:PD40 domain-containing protein [Planctomycetota bacterium]
MSRHLGKNVVIVLALLSAGFFAAYLRFRPYLGQVERWSDGANVVDDAWANRIRHAIWDTPFVVDGEVNTPEAESRPTLSHDGRLLVFASGKAGLNQELYVAELQDGAATRVTALAAANSGFDDAAPAFGADALWFASNRPGGAGGFDLYRMPYRDGVFGTPEPIVGALATAADETDPAPMPDGSVVFASNRERARKVADFDLYRARRATPGVDGGWQVERFDALNSPADDREPATTADGRVLYFASNRGGDFDLYRSGLDRGAYLPPSRLDELSTAQDERGPGPSADGFTLAFDRPSTSGVVGDTDLVRARSLELFQLPGRPVGWIELLVLLGLLAVALLAWLARRWEALELIYKCLLFALIVHILLLWWFQRVPVESEPFPSMTAGRGEALFKVKVASAKSRDGRKERGGELETARASAPTAAQSAPREVAIAGDVAPSTTAMARPSQAESSDAPARTETELARSRQDAQPSTLGATLADQVAPVERLRGEAPALAMDAPRETASRSERTDGSATPRAVDAARGAIDAGALSERTRASRLDRGRTPTDAATGPTRAELASAPSHAAPIAKSTLADGETIEPLRGESSAGSNDVLVDAGAAPSFAADRSNRPTAGGSGPVATATELRATPSASSLAAGQRLEGGDAGDHAPAARETAALAPARPAATTDVEFADGDAVLPTREAGAAAEPGSFELVASDTTLARPSARAAAADSAPLAFDLPAPTSRSATPLVAAAAPERAPEPKEPERLDHTPYRNRFGLAKEQALKEHGGDARTEHAVDLGLSYLAGRQNPEGFWGDVEHYDQKYGYVSVGKSGLCLLAFLGKGHTPTSNTEHSAVAARAVQFLLEVQDADSGHFGWTSAYSHGIATYALAECYALTRMESLKLPLERAVAHILANQSKSRDPKRGGGWGYYNPQGPHFDNWARVSITSWQVMALESARLSGIEVPDAAFDAAKAFLTAAYDARRGCYRYSHDPSRLNSEYAVLPGSTPAALFALSLLGEDISGESFAKARRFVTDRAPRAYRRASESAFVHDAAGNLYFWYYGTLSTFRTGGADWELWNEAMKATLLPSQQKNGSWAIIDTYAADIAQDTDRDRCYTTAMNVLALEVYYRYFTPLLSVK